MGTSERFLCAAMVISVLGTASSGAADIIKDGNAQGAIWHQGDQPDAAKDLVAYLKKMTGAEVPVEVAAKKAKPPAGTPAIVLGALALEMGLAAPPKTVSQDGYALRTKGDHLLMAGESPTSTRFAVTHFLETHGYRWLWWGPWGEAVPELRTVSLDGFDVREEPDFRYRNVWGADQARTRTGGIDLPNRHDWGHVPADKYFEEHPEYFALRGGERRPGSWMCTSHPDVAKLFAEAYIAKAKTGIKADTISPPDGRGFCECDKCKAQDVPDYIEPSSGTISMSDRYARFFEAVGRQVKQEAPDLMLSFYCYSDYTLAPKLMDKASDNLCAWVTTIRFCRLHGISNPNCESRQRYKTVVEGWAKLMLTACYDYNYNLAEVTVPISKISYFRDNIPFLKKTGCWGINLECMCLANLYAPHTYLAARLMWDADGDADAILDDFYAKAFGATAPPVKSYWDRIDKAVREVEVHCGSFHGVHALWTQGLVAACQKDLDAAANSAGTDLVRTRVKLFQSGLDNVKHYLAVRAAINGCDFAAAKETYEKWIAHMNSAFDKGFSSMRGYRCGYAKRFLLPAIDRGYERTTEGRKLIAQLPDEWDFRYDPKDEGEGQGWFNESVSAEGWRRVKTYSATLNEQKIPEQLTWMWYRTRLKAPAKLPEGPLHLWFAEVDGRPTKVYLNGESVGEFAGSREPGEVEVTGKLLPGRENVVAIKTGHFGISELMLGGLLKPAMVYSGPRPEPPPKKKQ